MDVNLYQPRSGRIIEEYGDIVNMADVITGLSDKSGGVRIIDKVQSSAHDRVLFNCAAHGTLAASSSLVMFGETGAKQVHFDGFSCDLSQGGVLVSFYESPTITANGTLQDVMAKNRATVLSNTMIVYAGGTVSANGTLLSTDLLLDVGQGSNVLSGSVGLNDGWILKENTDYMIMITNQKTSDTEYNLKFTWHEPSFYV